MSDCLKIRPLFHGSAVAIQDVQCRVHEGGCGSEEQSDANEIVFLRAGSFARHLGRRRSFLDTNQVAFFNRSETYCVSHPVTKGDDCTALRFATETLIESMVDLLPGFQPNPDRPFPFSHCLIPAGVPLVLHHVRTRIVRGMDDPLEIEEEAMGILGAVADAIAAWHGRPPAPGTEKTIRARRELVDRVRELLAAKLDERLSLETIGRAVGCSPYHLARAFHCHAGAPIHQYRNQLRLRAALERIWQGERDLTQMALSLGYCSHSHFTDSFRRVFGKPPSDWRRSLTRTRLGKMRKILEA